MSPDERLLPDDAATPVMTDAAARRAVADPAPLGRGENVGRYVILDRVGQGGMGVVYAAYDPELDRKVAIKLVRPDLQDADSRARLMREAKAMARLRHPAVIAIHDIGVVGDRVFLAMEFIDGVTLAAWLRAAPRSWREVLAMFLQAGRGLAAAHQAGVLHRDFKPDNLLVARDGRALVTDFGLARPTAPAPAELETLRPAPDATWRAASDLTDASALLGTPPYMAPEQLAGRPADERSEQFSFCVALFEGLYGVRPFAGTSAESLRAAMASGRIVPRPAERTTPAWLDHAVVRGLSHVPSQRWPTMHALLAALERGGPRRRWPWAAAGALGLAAAFAALRPPADAPELCLGSEARIGQVWGDARRQAIRRALLANGTGDRSPTVDAIEREVGRYAGTWAEARRNACLATHARGEQSPVQLDRRMECFDRRLRELDGLLVMLERPEDDTLDRAAGAVRRLTPPMRCAVGEFALLASGADESPLASRLAELKTLDLLRRSVRVVPLAQQLVQDASAGTDAALRIEAQLLLGRAQLALGERAAAERTLAETYWSAMREGLDDLAAKAALERTYAATEGQLVEAALEWARHAEAAVMRAGGELQRLGKLEGILAQVEDHRGEFAAAREHYERALELLARAGEQGDVAAAHANYAFLLHRMGDGRVAREHYDRALELFVEHWGSDHPDTHKMRLNFAAHLASLGEEAQARALLEEARDGLERTLGSGHPSLGFVWGTLGALDLDRGRHSAARSALARAYALDLATHGPVDVRTINDVYNLGIAAQARGALAEARHFFEKALAATEALRGPTHPDVVKHLTELASVATAQRRYEAAREHLERALAVQKSAFAGPHVDTAWIIVRQAELAEATGKLEEARERYLEAVAVAEASTNAARPASGLMLHALALLERRMRRHADARRHAEAALPVLTQSFGDRDPRVEELRQWIAAPATTGSTNAKPSEPTPPARPPAR